MDTSADDDLLHTRDDWGDRPTELAPGGATRTRGSGVTRGVDIGRRPSAIPQGVDYDPDRSINRFPNR
jgi:hypothetical protein